MTLGQLALLYQLNHPAASEKCLQDYQEKEPQKKKKLQQK